jgi:hypothetical protein
MMMTVRDGKTYATALVLDREELDLSGLRAHCREYHQHRHPDPRRRRPGLPRSNADLAGWHWDQHHRYGSHSHTHRGPFTLVRNRRGSTVGQIARPLGWFTGREVWTKEQQQADWKARLAGKRQS